MSDVILPFPVLLMTIVAVVVSFVLILLENENAEQQCKQVKHFTVMMAATTAGTKRTNKEVDIDDVGRTKQRMVNYNHEHAKSCIQQDYIGLSPIFNHRFQWIFCITQGMYFTIVSRMKLKVMNSMMSMTMMISGHPTLCIDAKMRTALKHLGYGCATNAWIDYLQI